MKVITIKRNELRSLANEKRWSQDDSDTVDRLISEWFDQQAANSIMLFFNNINKFPIACYKPLYIEIDSIPQFDQSVLDFPQKGTQKKIIGLKPEHTDEPPSTNDQQYFLRQAKLENFWDGTFAVRILNNGANGMRIEEWSEPGKIEFRHIQHAREKMSQLQESFKQRHPDFDFAKAYASLIQHIEEMQNEFDKKTGYSELRRGAHDYALRLPDSTDGLFSATWIERFYTFIQKFLEKIHPSSLLDFDVKVAGTAPTSAVILLDIVSKSNDETVMALVEDTKKHLRTVLGATPILQQMGDPDNRIDEFCQKSMLTPEAVKQLMPAIEKMFPKIGEASLEVYTPSQPLPVSTFEADSSKNFDRAYKALKDSLRETDDLIVEGYLGQLAVWPGEPPKFQIKTDDKRKLTITYDPSQEQQVQDRLRQRVKVERIKVGRSWQFCSWK